MKLTEIRDRLSEHKEHYRVLPALAQNGLASLLADVIDEVDKEKESVVGIRTKATKKAPKRSKR